LRLVFHCLNAPGTFAEHFTQIFADDSLADGSSGERRARPPPGVFVVVSSYPWIRAHPVGLRFGLRLLQTAPPMNASDASQSSDFDRSSPFPRTTNSIWETVQQASGGDGDALRKLCVIYHGPILAYVSRWTPDSHEAADRANGFIEFLREVKFRSFLLKCLKGFLRDEWRRRTAGKRGHGEPPIPLDEVELGREAQLDPALDRQFALTVHRRAMEQLAVEHERKGESARFAGLKPFVLGAEGTVSYSEIGARLGMTANHVKVAVLRLRGRYSELFREEVLQTVARNEADSEMRYLITLLADSEAILGQ
jgi:RNA polymerase sigma-70 factor (ECF subfamily)